jgi:hypothetical protein
MGFGYPPRAMARLLALVLAASVALAATQSPAQAQEAPEGEGTSFIPLVVTGTGVLALGMGGIFAALSGSAHGDAVRNPIHAEAASSADSARTFATLANTMFVMSLCLVLFGGGWTAIELSYPSRRNPPASARLGIGPGSLSIAGEF